jgi:uncharacterized protein YbbK (DUF523 family)
VKLRVGISRCLLGDDVRYDGTNRRSAAVVDLAARIEWISVCPEVEIGMGVPREPIQLVAHPDGVRSAGDRIRVSGVHTGEDWTARMDHWARGRAAELAALHINGFVLKARSPSCGPAGVLVHHDAGDATPTGRGLFAEALAAAMSGLPMSDEEALEEPRERERFLQRVHEYAGLGR